MKEEKINNLIYKVKSDSILREEPLSSSYKFITALEPNTEVEYLNETKEENDEVKYDKVKIINNKNDKEQIGWILHNQIILRKKSLSIESKNNILKTINQFLNLPTAYSMEFPQRNGGFFNKLYDDKYYFDCSSFVTTVLNRNFNFPPPYPTSDDGGVVVWATIHYFENIQKENSCFDIIQKVEKPGECLDLNILEIGDIILGRAKKILGGINHILFYVGEGYYVHCTRGNLLGKKENRFREGVVKEKLEENYYTEIERQENIEKGNITKRFDGEIYVIRIKENENKKV